MQQYSGILKGLLAVGVLLYLLHASGGLNATYI